MGHGTYGRKTPVPLRVARFDCRDCQTTFSRLPDFAAARRRGSLQEIEDAMIGKRSGNMTQALRNPPQRTLEVSPDNRLHERIERLLKAVLDLDRRLAAPPGRRTRSDGSGSSPSSARPR